MTNIEKIISNGKVYPGGILKVGSFLNHQLDCEFLSEVANEIADLYKNDKIINFIRVDEFDTTLNIPNIFQYTGLGYLSGKTVNELMNAEADSTMASLIDYKRPNVTLTIPKITPYYIGQLLYFFEIQTAITGALYNINAYNQPGVEQLINYTYALMDRIGYEDSANELKKKLSDDTTVQI